MLHAVRALLAVDKFDSKTHHGVIAFLGQNYIKNKKFELKYVKFLTQAIGRRNDSDYDDFYYASADDAKEQIESAKELFTAIQDFLSINHPEINSIDL